MNPVTTWDGRQVDSSSEAWRAHCEAVTILAMPLQARKTHLENVAKRRNQAAMLALRSLASIIWTDRKARELNLLDVYAAEDKLHTIGKQDAQGDRLRADIRARMRELISKEVEHEEYV